MKAMHSSKQLSDIVAPGFRARLDRVGMHRIRYVSGVPVASASQMDNRAWFFITLAATWPSILTAKKWLPRPAEFAQINSGIALDSVFKQLHHDG